MHLSVKPALKLGFPIRIVIDHHVDRPGVEVPQGMELTGTNHPIDFINPLVRAQRRLPSALERMLD